jgi:sialic acid synthase SpsE
LSEKNIWVKRPGTGQILAKDFQKVLNYKATIEIPKNTQIEWNMIEK